MSILPCGHWSRVLLVVASLLASPFVLTAVGQEPRAPGTPVPPIATDRPGFNAPAVVQAPGVVQLELGWGLNRGGAPTTSTAPQPLLRVGLVRRVELQVASAGLVAGCVAGCRWQRADASVGARVSVPAEALGVGLAVTGAVSLPVGHAAVGSGHRDPSMIVHLERALPAGFGLLYNAIVLRAHDADASVARYGHGLSLGYSVDRWAPYVLLARRPARIGDAVPWLVQAGTTYRVAGDVQVDVTVDRGLTVAEPSWGVAAGLVLRHRPR
jgi:hypothetical protein